MRKWIMLLLCLILVSCAGWNSMSREKKIEATVSYYRTFSAGLSMAADIAASVKPELAPAVQTAKTTIRIMDAAVDAYAAKQTTEQAHVVYGAAQAANAAVAEIAVTDAKESQIQSFFDDSTPRTVCRGSNPVRMVRYGINLNGPETFSG
jgi:hypothetical protein